MATVTPCAASPLLMHASYAGEQRASTAEAPAAAPDAAAASGGVAAGACGAGAAAMVVSTDPALVAPVSAGRSQPARLAITAKAVAARRSPRRIDLLPPPV